MTFPLLPEDTRAWIEVDLSAICANVKALSALAGAGSGVMAVVKADAYGHGIVPVSQAALEAGALWLGVATVSEAVSLRTAGIGAPILLLCGFAPGEAEAVSAHRLTATIGDAASLQALCAASRGRSVEMHLDVDTGIGRAGALPEHAVQLWRQAVSAGIRVTGLTTHFADADGPDPALTHLQIAAFAGTRLALEGEGARFEWVHLSNSPAALGLGDLGANLIRPGLLLYGILPPNHPAHPACDLSFIPLALSSLPARPQPLESTVSDASSHTFQSSNPYHPALALKARVATVRALPEGHSISYGATHRLTRNSRVATVLIGYGDGYPRRLSNVGSLLLKGRYAPILGRVCMDQTVVDVTDIPDVAPGDVAVCLGKQDGESITAEHIASQIDATEHEVVTCLTPRLPRLYLSA